MRWPLILSLFPLLSSVLGIVLPSETGPYRTQVIIKKITDQSRSDPYATDGRKRSPMLSIISPVSSDAKCRNLTTRYMPDLSAAFYDQLYAPITTNGTFESIQLSTCPSNEKIAERNQCKPTALPIVIFSPGLGNSRLLYSALCQSIASHGFHIITVDHPYDAPDIVYPDGSYVLAANITTDEQIKQDISVRVEDIKFLVNSLMAGKISPFGRAHEHSQIFMLGHSLGGATTLSAMLDDSRILAGANMDGKFFPDVLPKDGQVARPFLLIGNQDRNASTDSTWDLVLKKYLSGPTSEFQLSGTEHGSFTDLPLLLKAVVGDAAVTQMTGTGIGSVDGLEILRTITDIVVTFFRGAASYSSTKMAAGTPSSGALEKHRTV